MAEKKEATLTINDTQYKIADLPDEAKMQLANLNFAEAEMRRLQGQLALATTARNAYRQVLAELVSENAK